MKRIVSLIDNTAEELVKKVLIADESLTIPLGFSSNLDPYIIDNIYKDYSSFEYTHLTRKQREANLVPVRTEPKIGRNSLCPCGSGRKFKNCCLKH